LNEQDSNDDDDYEDDNRPTNGNGTSTNFRLNAEGLIQELPGEIHHRKKRSE